MTPTANAIARQFSGAFEGLRTIIEAIPDDQWYAGATQDQIPARRAHHAIMWAGRYCRPVMGHHPVARGGTPETRYRDRQAMLAYLDETACQTRDALEGATADQFTASPGGPALLEHWIYNLRHLQHHVGQLSSTLRERRMPPMKWH